LYFDEIYEVYVVQPTLRFSTWLWQVVDVRGLDRGVVGIGRHTVSLARWLWQVVDVKGIDREVVRIGDQTMSLARWLWQIFDVRRIEEHVERLGPEAEATGHMLPRIEPRTLQHHLLVMIFWLVAVIGLFYWLVR